MTCSKTLLFLSCLCLPPNLVLAQEPGPLTPGGNGDVNADGRFDLADAIYIINYQFRDGPAPVPLSCLTPATTEDELDPSRHADATFATEFFPRDCEFETEGDSPFFILEPGYRLVLEGEDEGTTLLVWITVLDEIEVVDGIPTRVVEEREWEDGELLEVSRNFFVICEDTEDLYYYGEDVDIYEGGKIVSHDGAWRAGVDGAEPGVLVPGSPIVGARHFQEVAPGVALDRAEVIDVLGEMEVPAGTFPDVLFQYETSGLSAEDESVKYYAAGIGLIKDDEIELLEYGFLGEGAPEGIPFAATKIFLEFNHTDLDLGIHIFFDAEGWKEVSVAGETGEIFEVENGGSLQDIGSTEVFTESAEPPLDEENLDEAIAAFLARFPAGVYDFEGETVGGDTLVSVAVLSHDLPAAPGLIFPNPDLEENVADPDATVIEWRDTSEEGDPAIVSYQAIVEFEAEKTGDVFKFVVDVAAAPEAKTHSVTVPVEFFERLKGIEGEYKGEILAIAASGNATISEHEFELADEE